MYTYDECTAWRCCIIERVCITSSYYILWRKTLLSRPAAPSPPRAERDFRSQRGGRAKEPRVRHLYTLLLYILLLCYLLHYVLSHAHRVLRRRSPWSTDHCPRHRRTYARDIIMISILLFPPTAELGMVGDGQHRDQHRLSTSARIYENNTHSYRCECSPDADKTNKTLCVLLARHRT